jgi:hypothetical protein
MPRTLGHAKVLETVSQGFIQRRRPLNPGEIVPHQVNLLGQVLALREAAKHVPPPRQEDETWDVDPDSDPDLPD